MVTLVVAIRYTISAGSPLGSLDRRADHGILSVLVFSHQMVFDVWGSAYRARFWFEHFGWSPSPSTVRLRFSARCWLRVVTMVIETGDGNHQVDFVLITKHGRLHL